MVLGLISGLEKSDIVKKKCQVDISSLVTSGVNV